MKHTLAELRSGKLLGIKKLKIEENLEVFPEEIFTLCDSLELLDMSANRLEELPDLSRLTKLKIAFFSQNNFKKVPDSFKKCHNLFMLGLKSNAIEEFEEDILPLSISWLILTENRLSKLPDSIGNLVKMQKFPLAGNRLKSLPESMKNLRNLELLRVSANELSQIPQWIKELPKLAWFSFSGNPCAVSRESSIKIVTFKDLEMDKLLGEGASGKIYQAHSQEFKKIVAVKLFKGAVTSDGYAKDEMNACLSAGEHPNLIKVLARLEHKHLGLVLEFINPHFKNLGNPPNFETCSRDTYEEGFSLRSDAIYKIAKAVLSAITHLHQKGLLHGDLYAHNILVDEEYKIYLGDFGATSFYDRDDILLQKLEVLAFGNLLDDLLLHCKDKESSLTLRLEKIRDITRLRDVASRPLFSEIEL
jgi:hypothetical protein